MQVTGDYIISTLRKDKPTLEKELGVNALALFGSYAKNKQNEDSDIDLLLEQKEVDHIKLVATLLFIQKRFPGKKVQLTRKGPHLSQKFLTSIQRDLIYV
jgi:predicted nucleotidyltransferase